jgi:hypothetical protein
MAQTALNEYWHGPLTLENIEGVVTLLRQLLGGRRYTVVSAHEGSGFKPEVLTSQRLGKDGPEKEIGCHIDTARGRASLYIHDSYGVHPLDINLKDVSGVNPYFEFKGNQVIITCRSASGHKLYWAFAPEDEEV